MAGAHAVGVVSSAEKGELVKQLGAVDYIDRNEFAGMMRKGGETPDQEKARFKVSREFSKRVKELLGDQPDIVFEHVGQATFPTSVFTVKPFGKVVICAGTTGYNLDFDVRYLWMRQKQIIGSHFANAYECNKANQLIESAQIRPVLWRTLGFDGVPEAHQLMRDNQHLGKIAILVGAEQEGAGKTAEGPGQSGRRWAHDRRSDPLGGEPVPRREVRGAGSVGRGRARLRRDAVVVLPCLRRAPRLRADRALPLEGALRALLVLEQVAEKRVGTIRLLPDPDPADLLGGPRSGRGDQPSSSGAIVSPESFQLLPSSARPAPSGRSIRSPDRAVDDVRVRHPLVVADPGQHARQRSRHALEGVVVVVGDDDAPVAAQPAGGTLDTGDLDGIRSHAADFLRQ